MGHDLLFTNLLFRKPLLCHITFSLPSQQNDSLPTDKKLHHTENSVMTTEHLKKEDEHIVNPGLGIWVPSPLEAAMRLL